MEAPRLPAGWRLVALDTVGSTNDDARRLARDGGAAGTVVWARAQTAGRGRQGRAWASPKGNLYVSILLRPPGPSAEAAQLGFAASVALGEALDAVAPAARPLAFKWPNDVLLGGRKLAGLLLESEGARADGLDALVVGVGVNLASHPPDSEFPATDLRAACGIALAPGALLAAFVARFDVWVDRWSIDGFAPLRAAWRARAHGLGATIRVRLPRETLTGTFVDLDEAGLLLLDAPDGRRRISAGDVFFDSPV